MSDETIKKAKNKVSWYDSLTQEEKDSLKVKLCLECCHAYSDNPFKLICKDCEANFDLIIDIYV